MEVGRLMFLGFHKVSKKGMKRDENVAFLIAERSGTWSLCPACVEGFLDLHCQDPRCRRLRCRRCDFVLDPETERFSLPPKKKRIEIEVKG